MRFHLLFYVLIALLGFSSIALAQVDTWTKKADMPTARWILSTSVVNGKIYAIGGTTGSFDTSISVVEMYDPTMDTWTRRADMPTPRNGLSTSVVNGKIYAIGGTTNDFTTYPTVEEYDPATDTWTKKADMPTPRSKLVTGVVNGKIYAIGGTTLFPRPISAVEEYDPATDTWTKKADMPTPRLYLSAGVVNGKIYVIGGWDAANLSLSTVEVYDPVTDTWTKRANMPIPRSRFSTSVVEERIYAVGGVPFGPGINLATVEVYDPATGAWTQKTSMPTARSWLSTSMVNGFIYAIGGNQSTGGAPFSTVEACDTGMGVRVKAISPLVGQIAGGEPIAISGSVFPPGTSVTIGEKPLTDMKVTNTLITGLTPPGTAGEREVWLTITVPGLDYAVYAEKFRYILPSDVVVTGMTPTQGKLTGGDTGNITGRGFQQGASVSIGGVEATNVAVTPTLISFTIPPGKAGKVDVVVTNPDGRQDILRGAFTYAPPPTIDRISPTFISLQGFAEIRIKGSRFSRPPTVHISEVVIQRVDFIPPDELNVNVLSGQAFAIGPKDVIVTNPDGQRAILSGGVTVLASIKIKSVEPNSGGLAGGTKITIVGEPTVEFLRKSYPSRFVEGAEVFIGKEPASEVKVISDHIITAITPPNTPGPKDVKVVNIDGQSDRLDDAFSYNPLPQIIKVIPNNGPLSGGTKIRIQGSKFLPGAEVLIGDIDAGSFVVAPSSQLESDTIITAIIPQVPGEPGPWDVVVLNPDGQQVVLKDGFIYNPLPTIRDISPGYGPSSGGTKIIISGTGFLLGARVIIGKNVAVTSVKDDETIEAVTPANPKGVLDVKVLNPDTQEAIIQRAFTSVGELAYNYPNPFRASYGTTFRYVPGPNETVESIVVRIFNLAGVPIGVVGQEGSNEVRWQDSKVNVGLYVYLMEVKVGGKVKRFKRALEVYK